MKTGGKEKTEKKEEAMLVNALLMFDSQYQRSGRCCFE